MTFDPTTNRIQWKHLTEEEKEVLKAWEHGWEFWHRDFEEWTEADQVSWHPEIVYRAKPAPVVKSSWQNVHTSLNGIPYAGMACETLAEARRGSTDIGIIRLDLIDGKLSVEVEQ